MKADVTAVQGLFIAIIPVIAVIVLWTISTQRRLVVLDENININNAMSQIEVQLSSCFDALIALLDVIKSYAKHESETPIEAIKSRRSLIATKSTPDDVLRQERNISETLGRIAMVTEQHPELKANQTDQYLIGVAEQFGGVFLSVTFMSRKDDIIKA